jgi:hypothetical protein
MFRIVDYPGNFIGTSFGLSFENRREARKLGLLPYD